MTEFLANETTEASPISSDDRSGFFGLLELDGEGTVRYARSLPTDGDRAPSWTGKNFYEVAPMSNIDEFRLLVNSFIAGGQSISGQEFVYRFDDGRSIPARILFSRSSEHNDGEASTSILLQIKRV